MTTCPVCKIVFRPGEKALWCPKPCPQTPQRAPTEQQQIQLGMKEEK